MYTTLREDVNSITSGILAIQAADDQANEAPEDLDTTYKYRGAASGMDATFLDMAMGLGMSKNKFPESNVKDLFNRSFSKMVRNYIFMLIFDAATRHGFDEDDAINFAAASYRNEKEQGLTDQEILKGWL